DEAGKHPERKQRKLAQQRDQVGVIDVKGRPQNDVGPNHPNNMGHDPLLPNDALNPWHLAKASCPISQESKAIPDERQEEEISIDFPSLSRQDGRGEKDDGIGPEIAGPPPIMTPSAFRCTERHETSDSCQEARHSM